MEFLPSSFHYKTLVEVGHGIETKHGYISGNRSSAKYSDKT